MNVWQGSPEIGSVNGRMWAALKGKT